MTTTKGSDMKDDRECGCKRHTDKSGVVTACTSCPKHRWDDAVLVRISPDPAKYGLIVEP